MKSVLLTSLILLLCTALVKPQSDAYYVDGIQKVIDIAATYTFPTNAYEYKATRSTVKDYGVFDFIIVGAGASGAVMGRRLSENLKFKVLVLEAGNFSNPITDIPAMAGPDFYSPINWAYQGTPQTTSCQDCPTHQIFYSAGKGVGGSTLINTMAYLRGSPVYYEELGKNLKGWSFKDVLPYFKKSENITLTDPEVVIDPAYHGFSGPLHVQYRTPRHPASVAFLAASQELGYRIVDPNSNDIIGTSVMSFMAKEGERDHTGKAYLEPVLSRRNLKVLTESYATKVLITPTSKQAYGVEFVHRGQKYTAYTRKEVILSAGSIKSSQLLMLSGVGPKEHLESLNISLIADLEVGSRLLDQPAYRALYFKSNYTKSGDNLTVFVQDYLKGHGPLTTPLENDAFTFVRLNSSLPPNDPDIQLVIACTDGFVNYTAQYVPDRTFVHLNNKDAGFYLVIVLQKPQSHGTLRLRSSDPFDFPLIDANYFSDPLGNDLNNMYLGLQKALELANTTAFKAIGIEYIRQDLPECDGEEYLSKAYWLCSIRAYITHIDHQMGTCPMGTDPKQGAVTDAETRVHGIGKLRVVDASIFPATFSGHPTSHCVMAAEKISDMIKHEYSL